MQPKRCRDAGEIVKTFKVTDEIFLGNDYVAIRSLAIG